MEPFVVSARKYRPTRFEDVVGQAHVAGTLKNALATGQVAHAFLFTGPRGVGKTTCARILAKVLNCENPSANFDACGQCSACQAFQENASFNIFELDAASNNGVDHIRSLVESVRIPPQGGKFKVYIIDEVHMLSPGAFNAFLKTLEEPPPHVKFILATTERHKIIPTILSRCQIFDFRRITVADTVAQLQVICKKEGIEAEADALHIIAQKSDGAMRDALSIFDRISAATPSRKITYAGVIENLNILDYDYFFQITDSLLAEDLPGVFNLFDQILRKGFEPDTFLIGLAEHLRDILVCKDEATLALLEVGDSLRERYRRQAALAPTGFLLTTLNLANDCDINYKMARQKRLHVEMALTKMTFAGRAIAAAKLGGQVEFQEKKTLDLTGDGGRATIDGPRAAVSSNLPSENSKMEAAAPVAEPAEKPLVLPVQQLTIAAEPEEDSQPTPASASLAEKKLGSGKSLLNLSRFDDEVAEEEKALAEKESRLSLENAAAEWKILTEQTDSQQVRIAMQGAVLSLDGQTLLVKADMATRKNLLQAEVNRCLDHLRQALHDPRLQLRIELDEAKAEALIAAPPPRKAMTNKERFDQMQGQNPLVGELVKRFELRLEE